MTLRDIAFNARCRVTMAAAESRDLRSRLYALGVFPGAELSVIRCAPLGDPLQIRAGQSTLSIRRVEASQVEVQLL